MKNVKNSFAKSFLALSFVLAGSAVMADQSKDHAPEDESIESSLKVGVIEDVGNYKLRVDHYGEPAAMPLRISLELDCGPSKRPFVAFTDVTACGGGAIKKDKKNLVLSYLKPDQKSKCTRSISETLALADVCK
ncbi:MAG: hypothetical protein ABIR96_03610 [Bdellovibrionota bacterium]